jgi:hypothetical protein
MIGVEIARAQAKSRPISSSAGAMPGSASMPSTYSCWASITTIAASRRRAGRTLAPAISSSVFGGMRSPRPVLLTYNVLPGTRNLGAVCVPESGSEAVQPAVSFAITLL